MASPSDNRRTYVPPHVQQQMSKQLQQSVPKHMQQYVGAFMEQNVVNPTAGMTPAGTPTGRPATYKPVTHLPRSSHYNQYHLPGNQPGELHASQPTGGPQPEPTGQPAPGTTVQPQSMPTQPVQPQAQQPYTPQPGQTPYSPPPNGPPQGQPYDFIMNPEPPKKGFRMPGGNSLLARIAIFGGGITVLLVLFVFVKGLFGGESLMPYYVSIAQDQQQLIHLTTNAQDQEGISTGNLNFAYTATLSLGTSQSELLKLLAESGTEIKSKELELKIDPRIDEELATAAAATTYNQTFQEKIEAEISDYMHNLEVTYSKTTSQTGRDLLDESHAQAELLLKQLKSGTNLL